MRKRPKGALLCRILGFKQLPPLVLQVVALGMRALQVLLAALDPVVRLANGRLLITDALRQRQLWVVGQRSAFHVAISMQLKRNVRVSANEPSVYSNLPGNLSLGSRCMQRLNDAGISIIRN